MAESLGGSAGPFIFDVTEIPPTLKEVNQIVAPERIFMEILNLVMTKQNNMSRKKH